ncbi:MobQ family relaxase [Phaeobacter inhibens]|nr:MobQ family relaxase [Phaeobacter inhibens]
MASYHLSVKTIKRSAGRSSTAAAAYRAGDRIECQREGRVHDYSRKQGVEETFIVAPENAPAWAQDRSSLWNEAEATETRRNSVTAREWELALPSEITAEDRSQITREFAEQLVERYGVAVDVAIHAPHREGDQRNHHAHVLTSTRKLEAEGFTTKTRVLDSAKTGGVEIEQMRGVWAELQNRALERVGEVERVDHRSLEAQREAAQERGDTLSAEELDRDPELKLGPAANSMERREKAAAARDGRDYIPVTERGAAVHTARQARAAFREVRERLDRARKTYGAERESGQGRVSAGLAALREAASKGHGVNRDVGTTEQRLAQIVGRSEPKTSKRASDHRADLSERLSKTLGRTPGTERKGADDKNRSIEDRLDDVLNKPQTSAGSAGEDKRERDKEEDAPHRKDRGTSHER